jgi:hypothetical protein
MEAQSDLRRLGAICPLSLDGIRLTLSNVIVKIEWAPERLYEEAAAFDAGGFHAATTARQLGGE